MITNNYWSVLKLFLTVTLIWIVHVVGHCIWACQLTHFIHCKHSMFLNSLTAVHVCNTIKTLLCNLWLPPYDFVLFLDSIIYYNTGQTAADIIWSASQLRYSNKSSSEKTKRTCKCDHFLVNHWHYSSYIS